VLVSASYVFPPYPRHRRKPMGMRDGSVKAAARSQPATELLAPSARSLTYLRIEAHSTQTAFATATTAEETPLSRHSGVAHCTHTPSTAPPTDEPPPWPAQSRRLLCQAPAAGPHVTSYCARIGD